MRKYTIYLTLFLLYGCASGVPLQRAQLKTAGIEIIADNVPLVIRPFEPFKPIGVAPSACYTDGTYSTITPVLFEGSASSQLATGLKAGAIPVQIRILVKEASLYGRLLFCPIDKSAAAYGMQEYEIFIPDNYIEEALSGKLTAVFAKTPLKSGWKEYTWILWLSKEPITEAYIAQESMKPSIGGDSSANKEDLNPTIGHDGVRGSNTLLSLGGTLLGGAVAGAITPGDVTDRISVGLATASVVAAASATKSGARDNLLAGAVAASNTYGDTTTKLSRGLEATMRSTTSELQAEQHMAEIESNASNRRIAQSTTNNTSATGAISECPPNFNHLSSEMPEFRDPFLQEIRLDILGTSISSIIASSKQQGMSKSQTINLALRQADEFESTARTNAKAGAGVSTELTTRGIVTAVKTGRMPLNLPCSGSASMVQAAQCGVISQIWGANMNREIAKFMQACW